MRRCPECGFRANDTVCPLCGVRMGHVNNVPTHTHTGAGERCVLPNREPYRPVPKQPERKQESTGKKTSMPQYAAWIIVLILFGILRSCVG